MRRSTLKMNHPAWILALLLSFGSSNLQADESCTHRFLVGMGESKKEYKNLKQCEAGYEADFATVEAGAKTEALQKALATGVDFEASCQQNKGRFSKTEEVSAPNLRGFCYDDILSVRWGIVLKATCCVETSCNVASDELKE